MQTFVPATSMYRCAGILDVKRLGKQRVEVLQLLNAIHGKSKGWVNHPAAVMWRENVNGLIAYGAAMCQTWTALGYKDTCNDKILAFGTPMFDDLPTWWGDERVHSSHRANLLRKDPDWYGRFGWTEDPNTPYFWPNQEVINV